MKHFNKLLLLFAVFSLLLSSCDDDHSYVPTMTDVPCAVVVNQGAMGYMPGTLDVLNLTDGTYTPTVLTLGGSPQNIAECGGYLFIPLFEEDAVAVYDKSSLRAAGRIAVPAPQNVCTDGERIFAPEVEIVVPFQRLASHETGEAALREQNRRLGVYHHAAGEQLAHLAVGKRVRSIADEHRHRCILHRDHRESHLSEKVGYHRQHAAS